MPTRLAARAAFTALGLAVLLTPRSALADPGEVNGIWAIQSETFHGAAAPGLRTGAVHMAAFDGTNYVRREGVDVVGEGRYVLDPSKAPAAIDLVVTKGPGAGRRQLGIYEVDGDTLRVCLAAPGARRRPRSFDAGPGSPNLLTVGKRVRP